MTEPTRFYFDWWVIPKRIIYLIISLLVLCILAAGAGLYVWKYGNPFKNVGIAASTSAGARFTSFEGDVRVVRAATRETVSATSETRLFPGDTVQTQADGRARITMADGSSLVVRPNSTVIIRDNTSSEGEGGRQRSNVRVAVDSGQINIRTDEQPDGTVNVIETRQTMNRMSGQTDATFGVNATDQTEEIRIGTGSIESTTKSGEKATLRGGEYMAVNPAGTLRREKLLDVPGPAAPADLAKVSAGAKGSTDVYLRWHRPVTGAPSYYRVEVATSPFFVAASRVVERDQLPATEFNATDLRSGVYFWRVRAVAASGQASEWCEPQKFIVAPPGTGDRVNVTEWSTEYLGGSIYILRGRAQPGTTIRITERETVAPSDGRFQLQITVPNGAREVQAEARDPDGNSSRYKLALTPTASNAKK